MKTILLATIILALTGCGNMDYKQYSESIVKMETAKSRAEAERFKAIAAMSAGAGDATRAAIGVALAMGATNQGGNSGQMMQAPKDPLQTVVSLVGIAVPALTNLKVARINSDTNIVQSNNAATVAMATTSAFVSIAGKIQAPAANIITNTDSHDIKDSYNQANTTLRDSGNTLNANTSNSDSSTTNNANVANTNSGNTTTDTQNANVTTSDSGNSTVATTTSTVNTNSGNTSSTDRHDQVNSSYNNPNTNSNSSTNTSNTDSNNGNP